MELYICLIDKRTKEKSNRIPIENVIYNQNEINFIFPFFEILPYNKFLSHKDYYELIFEFE